MGPFLESPGNLPDPVSGSVALGDFTGVSRISRYFQYGYFYR